MKKIFVDIYLAFNLGDDLFLDILSKKYPNCKFTLNYSNENYDQFISQYSNIDRRRYTVLEKIVYRLKNSDSTDKYDKIVEKHDALLFIGGSIFMENKYHNLLHEKRMKIATEFKKRNKPIFVLGANFGPFETQEFLDDYTEFFKLCDDICFRDIYSYELFKNLSQVRYAPDIVFQMNVDNYKTISNRKRVGFSIIDVRNKQGLTNYYNDYISSTVKSIELLVDRGYECCLMSFCEQEGDLQVINTIKSFLSPDILKNVSIYNYKGNLKEAIDLIASFKLLSAARFHANILGLLLGVGIMPIIYSQKTTNMLKDINLDGILIKMEQLYLQYDENIVNKSFNNKVSLENISKNAQKQFKKLSDFLDD
ncbi:polysaccharide pyruvyl transferase family protein [Priestia megaterium]|uniref:polysaccharide pyruvyl transferase family protein n=1 Tax=Priestia megaterium TaxID=1404 RepID=UPI002E1A5E86|nr:polysaccharide pyruvyl transferase family protein [Priestia megaterium]